MKTMGLRRLYQEAPSLTEEVWVVQGGVVIGTYTPNHKWEDVRMEEPVKKAIEPDEVKVERPGKPGGEPKLSKGLGDIPGVNKEPARDTFGYARPAPKPGKK